MKNPTVGASIAATWNGTVGLFLEIESGIMGLSCAHVLGNSGPDQAVTQPWSHDFKQLCQDLEKRIAILQRNLCTTTHAITKYVRNEELTGVKKELEFGQKLKGDDENETSGNLHFGTTTGTSEWDIIQYGSRQCIADYEFFKVDQAREPSTSGNDFSYPEKGVLGSVMWALAERTGPLVWDAMVRKDGRTTGLTFGFVGGVHADWKPGKLGDKDFGYQICSEYWVLGEEPELRQNFADHGDSGSSVIDKDGVVRGIIFAQVRIKKLRAIIDPHSKISDIVTVADRRGEDGKVDVDDIVTTIFERRCLDIVEDIEMILQRSGIGGKVIFNC